MDGVGAASASPAEGVKREPSPVELDPTLEVMLEEAAREKARLREQMAKVTLWTGVATAIVGVMIAVATLVSYIQGARAQAAVGVVAGGGVRAGFFATAIVFALLLFGVGVWFALKGLNE